MKLGYLATGLGLCLGLMTTTAYAQNPTTAPKKQKYKDPKSYGLGVMIGESLKLQGMTSKDLNMKELVKALEETLDGKATMTGQEANEIFQKFAQEKAKEKQDAAVAEQKKFLDDNGKRKGVVTLPSGMQYEILTAGTGTKPTAASKVTTHYHGTLIDGTVFDSSVDRGQPATFPVGGVIKGWQEILPMMPTGSKWKVFIPSELAYGSRPAGKIPANSLLIFEIELISIAQ